MTRKEFFRQCSFGAFGLLTLNLFDLACKKNQTRKLKNWAWITTDLETSNSDWQRKFATMRESGIDAILPEIFNSRRAYFASRHLPVGGEWLERILPLAKAEGLEVHAWMWSMPCNIPEIQQKHPEWFNVNGNGESSLDKPAYVDYYKFLCPSREDVQEFIQKRVKELAAYDDLDGIHLDYIRYPDVIIAEALQPKYGVVQDREYPEYDYCYCEVCREKFKVQTGIDPLELEEPSKNTDWRQFRYDSITNLVNTQLVPIAKKFNKTITAAVFPNWEAVRQQWKTWNLDAFLPMLYHNFYNGDINWIKAQTEKGVKMLASRAPLYSGLLVPQLSPDEFTRAIKASLDAGAEGVALFHGDAVSESHWKNLSRIKRLVTM